MAKQPEPVIYYLPEKPVKTWAGFFTFSFVLHILVVAIILFSPPTMDVTAVVQPVPQAIKIDLVAFNPELPAPPAIKEKPEKIEPLKIKKRIEKPLRALKTEKPAFSKPVVKKLKKSLKSRTFHPKKIIADAVKKIEKKAETDRPKSVLDRINRLKDDVGKEDFSDAVRRLAAVNPGNLKEADLSRMQVYQTVVKDIMSRNWVFSDKLAGDTSGMESRLMIKVLPDGRITDVWFDKRSGNSYLDETAKRTVMKVNFLPPLPAGIPYYHLVLGFTPAGLTR
ncbi:MAG: TonB family protein [Deltaproteobacteria bacterium]|nr:TonB family protein [Deltaproteobacteria bacterium]